MPFSTFERQNLTFISKRGVSKGRYTEKQLQKKKRCEISWFKETHLNFSYLGRTWYRSSSDLRFSSRKACILSSAICSRLFAYSSIRKSRMSRKFSPDIPLSEKNEDKCYLKKTHLMLMNCIHKITNKLTIKDITIWFSNMTELRKMMGGIKWRKCPFGLVVKNNFEFIFPN